MWRPKGFVNTAKANHVCKLKKLSTALNKRAWFDRLREGLVGWAFENSKADMSLFIFERDKVLIILLVYVDDILVTWNNSKVISRLIDNLNA